MRDQVVNVDLAIHVPVHDLRYVAAAAGSAECGALPDAAGHELEWPRLDLLARPRDTDDNGHAPAPVAALQRLPHEVDVSHALEAVIRAAVGQRDQVGDEVLLDLFRVPDV